MKRVQLLILALVAFATPATAQNLTGFRIEARAGYDSPSLSARYSDPTTTIHADNNEDGFGFGGEMGYDFPVGSGVTLGGYVGVDFSDADFCRPIGQVEQACLEVRRNIYVGARGGLQVGPGTLLYAKGGYSNGQARINFDDTNNNANDLVDSGSRDGWHFGFGAEQQFGGMFYAKLEYVYTIYSDLDFVNPNYTVTLDGNRSQIMGGLGLRF